MSLDTSVETLLAKLYPHLTSTNVSPKPLIIGLTGLQGSGKSTWASTIVKHLTDRYAKHAITVSLDDFYLTHDDLVALKQGSNKNKLLWTRGQPGTHDVQLAELFFQSLRGENDEGR